MDEGSEKEGPRTSKSSESAECPICLGVYSVGSLAKTKCDHTFCRSCVVELLKSSMAKCPLCRQRISAFDTTCVGSGQMLVEHPKSIFGGIYVQCSTEGLASYHFGEEESYISYSAAPPFWRLDNGLPPPEKKPFLNASYDAETRTFRGVVEWSPITFNGDSKWVYRILFSEDFMAIVGGEVIPYDAEGEKRNEVSAYGRDLFYVRLFDIEKLIG